MAREIVPSTADIEQAVAAEAASGVVSDGQTYAARLWLRLAGIDPDAVQVPPEDAADAHALEKAREVIIRRYPHEPRGGVWTYPAAEPVSQWLADRINELNGR
jgi:hypothetical protein